MCEIKTEECRHEVEIHSGKDLVGLRHGFFLPVVLGDVSLVLVDPSA